MRHLNYYACKACKCEWLAAADSPHEDQCPNCGETDILPHKSYDSQIAKMVYPPRE
jgi:hypothetical protein